jgi:serine/threonine protein kinase
VLLAHARNGFVPKVTDFGIAKVIASDETSSTRTNVAMGTPHYMAPEQIRDAKNVDARADVFSLGCLLYELVCGRRPFEGPDVLELLNAVALGRYLPPETIVPGLPDRVTLAIEGALRVDREQRIQDCASLLAVLAGTGAPPPRREVPEPMLVDPISERPGAMAPLSRPRPVVAVPTPSWSEEDPRNRPASSTPVPPIDPNAAPPIAPAPRAPRKRRRVQPFRPGRSSSMSCAVRRARASSVWMSGSSMAGSHREMRGGCGGWGAGFGGGQPGHGSPGAKRPDQCSHGRQNP